ncbi:LON peptidase substrate-binding domain-containing protein [Patulibacter brassicae]|jgi:Lon protease-like protein|uniref:LON peptidase substrate-binding domain-containing protein n=1 Tax=Patulibacter brassicae TaxID=1705717 RepID=A0ABU4VHV0_9ACTN|nr:LON peptidase substrate-binding domain-containing protein [Patulibacter brassicae]MDX8151389.1 LON peptidase substrate-binding domain-containing protein [Patulibacter brassicae]
MAQREEDLPLFPLGIVALPGEDVPLHLFEERYKELGARCIAEDREFGIVLLDEDGPRAIGCAMRVTEVLQRFEDGRLDVMTRGTRPFRVIEEHHRHAYASAEVEFLDDDAESPDHDAAAAVRQAYASLANQATEHEVSPGDLAAATSYDLAASVEFAAAAKQQLLEQRSENARLRQLLSLLRAALKRLEFADLARVRGASNGVVRFD